jgi:hypothetical protein
VYRTLGQYYTNRQDWSSAAAAYEKALTAARKIHGLFRDSSDQELFLKAQAPLIAEAKECFRRVGGAAEGERVDQMFASSAALAEQQHLAARARSRQYRRYGLMITLFNLLCVGLAAALAFPLRGRTPPGNSNEPVIFVITFIVAVVVCTVFTALFQICVFMVGLIRPAARGSGGEAAFVLSIVPWPVSLVMFLISWIR